MIKTAAPPKEEAASNARKAAVDTLAAELLNIDQKALKAHARYCIKYIKGLKNVAVKVVIAGGAGSGKTTIAGELSKLLDAKNIDFDEYIVGGFTEDSTEYDKRLHNAFLPVWKDLPKDNWIIEHVEACSKEFVDFFQPTWAVLVDPGDDRLKKTAKARNAVGTSDPTREARALKSAKKAKKDFEALKGVELSQSKVCRLKLLIDVPKES
jgi:hypothetical protein